MASPQMRLLESRYTLRDLLDQGGMGSVYRAWDRDFGREVAIKTIRDAPDEQRLGQFRREIEVLSRMSHPNIVDIYDYGEFEEHGVRKPYFVMPLLQGQTLDRMRRDSPHRLQLKTCYDIALQTARGLHAAHSRNIVHRDLKPANIFVLTDNTVKIIDFGVAHLLESNTATGQKGTLSYMSPEQLQGREITAASDQFALGVVLYEMLTRRRPFGGTSEPEVVYAIMESYPPIASEQNPAVSISVSQVIHKALSKQPGQRFASVQDFAQYLEQASHGETIHLFDSAAVEPRLQIAREALDRQDYSLAQNVIRRLDAEGFVSQESVRVKKLVEQGLRLSRLRVALQQANDFFRLEDYALALERVHDALDLDSENIDARTLEREIEERQTSKDIASWLRLARQHMDSHNYERARQALQSVLDTKPAEGGALQLLADLELRQEEYERLKAEKERAFDSAVKSWQGGEVTNALEKLERVLELDQVAPDSSTNPRASEYQELYRQVKTTNDSLREQLASAQRSFESGSYGESLKMCEQALSRYPGNAAFRALRVEVEMRQRMQLSAQIGEVDRRLAADPDLENQVQILREALDRFPDEPHFRGMLEATTRKRDLVNHLVHKARLLEEQGQIVEAISHWEIIGRTYGQFPGLDSEIERLRLMRKDQQRDEVRARRVEQIERLLTVGEVSRASTLAEQAESEYPGDSVIDALAERVRNLQSAAERAGALLAEARELQSAGEWEPATQKLREALLIDDRNRVVKASLIDIFLRQARQAMEKDVQSAREHVENARAVDPKNAAVSAVAEMVDLRRRQIVTRECLAEVRDRQSNGDLEGALAAVQRGLQEDYGNAELQRLRESLRREIPDTTQGRERDLETLHNLAAGARIEAGLDAAKGGLSMATQIFESYRGDPDVGSAYNVAQQKLQGIIDRMQGNDLACGFDPSLIPGDPENTGASITTGSQSIGISPAFTQAAAPTASVPAAVIAAPPRTPAWVWTLAGTTALVAASLGIYWTATQLRWHLGWQKQPVHIRTDPPNAELTVDGSTAGTSPLTLELSKGKHLVTAKLEGYSLGTANLDVTDADSPIPPLILRAIPLTLHVETNLGGGRLVLDDQPLGNLSESRQNVEIMEGDHHLRLENRLMQASARIQFRAASMPEVKMVMAGEQASLISIIVFRGVGIAQVVGEPVSIFIDGMHYDGQRDTRTPVGRIAPGDHMIRVQRGTASIERSMRIPAAAALILTAVHQAPSTGQP